MQKNSVLVSTGIISATRLFKRDFNQEVVGDHPEDTIDFQGNSPLVSNPDESLINQAIDTLEILKNTDIPVSDLRDLAQRFNGINDIPVSLDPSLVVPLQIGARESFWVTDSDMDQSFKIEAQLVYMTDHAYYWVENGIQYKEKDLINLANIFENQIYPTNRDVFGSEWSPGVDGDSHLYVVYASGLGDSIAGYFSSSNEFHPLAHEYSNMHEIFMLSADNQKFNDSYTNGVLAHEFQHMIHWYQDRNETTWLNEGLSELAAFINGYDVGGFDYIYTQNTDIQLNHWPNDSAGTSAHYGASFLFINYLYDQLGQDLIQALVAHQGNGFSSLDDILMSRNTLDNYPGSQGSADDLFIDWALTNYLMDAQILDGRYTYRNYPNAPSAMETETVKSCPVEPTNRTVSQYGVDYIRFKCRGDYTLRFNGSINVNLLPVFPYSGQFAFWSNVGDDSDLTLTRNFDFREISGPLTLSYWTWYDIEKDYDYVYLTVSTDGQSWEIIPTPSGTLDDPSGNSFGWGYNGLSGGDGRWIQEKVDLSSYAGEQIQIRFEYVTDSAVNGEGFLIDDILIPEIGYKTDFETGTGGWNSEGFVRVQNVLPQTFRIAIIERGVSTEVTYLEVDSNNSVDIPVDIKTRREDVILVVTGTTRFTRQPATYQFQVFP